MEKLKKKKQRLSKRTNVLLLSSSSVLIMKIFIESRDLFYTKILYNMFRVTNNRPIFEQVLNKKKNLFTINYDNSAFSKRGK